VSEAAGKILKAEMDKTLRLLKENRPHLDAVAKALLEKNRLYRKDLKQILPALSAKPVQH
jgi:ATP-dependent Zn protease